MSASITVVSIGPGAPELLTLEAAELLCSGQQLVLRTWRHPVADWLQQHAAAFSTLDALYDDYADFDSLHQAMAERLWQLARKAPLLYAVPQAASDGSVAALIRSKPKSARLRVLPGVTNADSVLAAALHAEDSISIVPASSLSADRINPSLPLLVTELDSRIQAGNVKMLLSDLYDDTQPVWFCSADAAGAYHLKQTELWQLDMRKQYDHTSSVLLPAVDYRHRQRRSVYDLRAIMSVLRGENGCPWDRVQTHQSLRPYLLEEAYEAAEAIDSGDDSRLADELGDVLLQIVFHAAVGEAQGSFNLTDISSAICEKMIYRHAHIFGDRSCSTPEEVSDSWEQLKRAEKGLHSTADAMRDIAKALPALIRAQKALKKAGENTDASALLPALRKRIDALEAALEHKDDPQALIGQLLLDSAALAQCAGIQAEEALEREVNRYIDVFAEKERQAASGEAASRETDG